MKFSVFNFQFSKKREGFTLIEMLVVIGIIGILASLILLGLGGARRAGADAKKIANLNQLRNSLELYYLKNGGYPVADGEMKDVGGDKIDDLTGIDLGKIDLSAGGYYYDGEKTEYMIGTTLEEGSSEGLNEGTIGGKDCSSSDFYCLASE